MKDYKVGKTCSIHGRGVKCYKALIRKPGRKRLIEKPKRKLEDNIKLCLIEIA
jgi:hypothetical protein